MIIQCKAVKKVGIFIYTHERRRNDIKNRIKIKKNYIRDARAA